MQSKTMPPIANLSRCFADVRDATKALSTPLLVNTNVVIGFIFFETLGDFRNETLVFGLLEPNFQQNVEFVIPIRVAAVTTIKNRKRLHHRHRHHLSNADVLNVTMFGT